METIPQCPIVLCKKLMVRRKPSATCFVAEYRCECGAILAYDIHGKTYPRWLSLKLKIK